MVEGMLSFHHLEEIELGGFVAMKSVLSVTRYKVAEVIHQHSD
jgi:hypothetical protein